MDDKELKLLLGLKIKEHRNKLHLTQEQFSERIGVSQRQVSLIELSKSFPKPITLTNILKVCECDIVDLFNFDSTLNENKMKHELFKMIKSFFADKIKILYILGKNI